MSCKRLRTSIWRIRQNSSDPTPGIILTIASFFLNSALHESFYILRDHPKVHVVVFGELAQVAMGKIQLQGLFKLFVEPNLG